MTTDAYRIAEATERLHHACERFKTAMHARGYACGDIERKLTTTAQNLSEETRSPLWHVLERFADQIEKAAKDVEGQ